MLQKITITWWNFVTKYGRPTLYRSTKMSNITSKTGKNDYQKVVKTRQIRYKICQKAGEM